MNWIYYSIIALFTGMFAQIIIKYLLIKQIKTIDIILLLSLLNGVFSLIYYINKKFNKKNNKRTKSFGYQVFRIWIWWINS